MEKTIYFDMDGTIADLYNVNDWLGRLRQEDATPYEEAKPLVNCMEFQGLINAAKIKGYKVGIISWGSKDASTDFLTKIRNAKRKWLHEHFPFIEWDFIHIIEYGKDKFELSKNCSDILFDDDSYVRRFWDGLALPPELIEYTLKNI